MRISIGHRLFFSVLLSILAVAATAVLLMRQNVTSSFTEYAVQIELDRLAQLSGELAQRYRQQRSWDFVPAAPDLRRRFIGDELARLQRQRGLPAPPPAPVPPEPPPAPPSPDGALLAPPLPPPVIEPVPPLAADDTAPDELGLQDRVSLLDAEGRYLAGRAPSTADDKARRAITLDGAAIGYLTVAKAARPSDAMAATFYRQIKDSLWLIVAASVILSAVAAVLLAAHFRQPILRLAEGARRLADGDYDTRLDIARSDELGALADSFNALAEKLGKVESSRRQWVADTSHELRTPLAVLRAQLEAMQDGVRPASAENLAAMLRQVLALNKLIDQLYVLARADVGDLDCQRQPVDVWELACRTGLAFAERFGAAGIAFEHADAPSRCTMTADPERLTQLLSNLYENCVRYSGAGTRVVLSARCTPGHVELIVDDSGPGVPEEALPQLSARFYRVDASRSREHGGAGLGLSLAQRIAVAHGGGLSFERSPLGGLRVRVTLRET